MASNKNYFLSAGEENCAKVIWDFVKCDEVENDLQPGNLKISGFYLYFIDGFMAIFNEAILMLEKKDVHPYRCRRNY